MVSRPYKCPLCQSAFRNESGMKWHISHRHEIPAAFDALGKDYEAKTANLNQENALLKEQVKQLQNELELDKIALIQKGKNKLELHAQISELNTSLQKAMIALAVRDCIIKDKLNIDMPEPFK